MIDRDVADHTEPIREDVDAAEEAESPRESRGPTRSALTRWLAQRQLKQQAHPTAPSYERCQERGCWGKATWTCPRCQVRSCSVHRVEHGCSLPYLPG